MAGIRVHLSITGQTDLIAHLAGLSKGRMAGQVSRTMFNQLRDDGVPDAQQRAPLLYGPLRESIRVEGPALKGPVAVLALVAGGEDVLYALKLHEAPFNLGPVSQSVNTEGLIGDKYITRAVDKNLKDWKEELTESIEHLLQTNESTR